MNLDIIALKEKINEAKFAANKAKRLADEAADLSSLKERAYTGACHRVRALEIELEQMTGKKRLLWW